MKKYWLIGTLFFASLNFLCGCNDEKKCGETEKIRVEKNMETRLYKSEIISTNIQQIVESYISYNSLTKDATWFRKGDIQVVMHICNFPEEAQQWLLEKDSIDIVVDGIVYSPADSKPNPMDRVFYDFAISNIKKK